MNFELCKYIEPNFNEERFNKTANCKLVPASMEKVAPLGYHATSIYPEYFKIEDKWYLAKDSRMDAVPIWDDIEVKVVEFRNIKKGDLVVIGRSEDGKNGIYLHQDCWQKNKEIINNTFAFRLNRTRETFFT